MLRTVHLYDELADKFGPIYKFEISSPSEAIRALSANVPGFLRSIKRDGQYALVVGKDLKGRSITDKFELNYSLLDHENDIHLVPVIDGCGGGNKGFFSVIIGVALIATAFVMPASVPLGIGTLTLSNVTVGLMGATFVLGGISNMIAAPVTNTNPEVNENVENRPSYMFNSVVNRGEQGGVLPLIYGGPLFVGSIVVATGVTIIQTGSNKYEEPDEISGDPKAKGTFYINYYHRYFYSAETKYSTATLMNQYIKEYYINNAATWADTIDTTKNPNLLFDYYYYVDPSDGTPYSTDVTASTISISIAGVTSSSISVDVYLRTTI